MDAARDDERHRLQRALRALHTSAGLTLGWVSFLIFLTGTLAYFHPEISQWMKPELRHPPTPVHGVESAFAYLKAVAPEAAEWNVGLPTERDPSLGVAWRAGKTGTASGHALLNAATGEPAAPRDTIGGRLFYSFHFTLMLPGVGYWIAGAAAMFMLVALVTGIVVHKKILADFFTFRPRHSPRRAWLDAHNVSSVLALPFHVVIVYTGLVTLVHSYMPWIMESAYPHDERGFFREAFEARTATETAPAQLEMPLREVATRLRELAQVGVVAADLYVVSPATADAVAIVGLRRPSPTFVVERNASGVANLHDSLYDFHLGRFAGWPLRWLLFFSGLAGSAMIATGLLVWSLRRRERAANGRSRFACYLVDRLNVATIVGCLLAIAAYFLANRLLPGALEQRSSWELRCFYAVWAAAAVHAFARPANSAWREQLWLVAGAFGALPLVSGAATGRHLLASFDDGDWLFAAFDGLALGIAGLAAAAAWKLSKAPRPTRAAEPRTPHVTTTATI